MGNIALIILLIEGIVILGLLGLLIYFIAKRIESKKQETFEDRNN
ncbi:MAG: hypothetical protein QNK23_16595 [Crocinitomicaceae bacterium]|nr:hypothetical protein [Crocinitomicaceae bacterium]